MPHAEALLMAAAIGLYLFDSALLLCVNEAVLVVRRKGCWSAGFGSHTATLRGRELYLPNPLTPTQPMFRMVWSFERTAQRPPEDWAARRDALHGLAPALWSLASAMFGWLPLALTGRFGDWAIVSAFALVYACALWIVLLLWRRRRKLGLRGKVFALLALDLLLCPPFALNAVRRLSLRASANEDFADAAQRLLAPADWQAAKAEILLRLDEEIAGEESQAPRMAALLARRALLAGPILQDTS